MIQIRRNAYQLLRMKDDFLKFEKLLFRLEIQSDYERHGKETPNKQGI